MANDRISQLPVEAAVSPTSGKARESQLPVEVAVSPTSGKARESQLPVEVATLPTSAQARTSQVAVEVVIQRLNLAYGQAQAVIANTSRAQGQAQAWISVTYPRCLPGEGDGALLGTDSFILGDVVLGSSEGTGATCEGAWGQAQALIYAPKYVSGQAQAKIVSSFNAGWGQAQADIKQTYYVVGQAQAQIKQTYNAFGQTQAYILAHPYAFGQAQADIKATSYVVGQSQADIKQTYYVHGQAQALIGQIGRAFGQAQADIKATIYGLGQAQADIKQTYYSLGQAQAHIFNTYYGLGQAQAWIKNIYNGHGQAQGDIKAVGRGHGQAQADIKQIYYAHGQAQGTIVNSRYAHGQAQAYIPSVAYLVDTFTRTRAFNTGIGTPDIGPTWTSPAPQDDDEARVNGQQLEIHGGDGSGFGYVQIYSDLNITNYDYFVDFRIETFSSRVFSDIIISPVGIAEATGLYMSNVNEWTLYDKSSPDAVVNFTTNANTWYRIRFQVQGGNVRFKIWDKNEPQPLTWAAELNNATTLSSDIQLYMDEGFNDNARILADNVYVAPFSSATTQYMAGQAQAFITKSQGLGQAAARITSAIKQGWGQAQATITPQYAVVDDSFHRTIYLTDGGIGPTKTAELGNPDKGEYLWFFANDRGVVSFNNRLEFLPMVDSEERSFDFGALVDAKTFTAFLEFHSDQYNSGGFDFYELWSPVSDFSEYVDFYWDTDELFFQIGSGDSFSTAFPVVDGTTYRMMLFVDSVNSVAKAKMWDASIVEPDWMFSGSVLPDKVFSYVEPYIDIFVSNTSSETYVPRVWVYTTEVPTRINAGQAQALISVPTKYAFGQAKADIKATVRRHGQAQAFIRKSAGYGQAQASITKAIFKSGQAQASITNRYPTGQAQALITTTKPSGQAQAYIKNTWFPVAQSAALIKQKQWAMAQAQAQIKQLGTSKSGQALALIYRPQGYGQARAYIIGGTNYIVQDTFGRTTVAGDIGTPDVGQTYGVPPLYNGVFPIYETSGAFVNGSELELNGTEDYDWIDIYSWFNAFDIDTYLDVKFSPVSDWATLQIDSRLNEADNFSAPRRVYFYIYYDPNNDWMDIQVSTGQLITSTGTTLPKFDDDTWYTFRFYVVGPDVKLKIWKRSDPEPGTWLIETTTILTEGGQDIYVDTGETNGGLGTVYLDNYFVKGIININGPAQTGQAQAWIRRNDPVGQAQAQIKRANRNHGQALATIKRTSRGFGQAQAYIQGGTITNAHGQAQAYIGYHNLMFAQAAAMIRKGAGYGQAQARITAFGQAGFGNAQGFIRRTDTNYASGQSAGQIKRNDFTGQAQALIAGGRYLVKYNGYQLPGYAQVEDYDSVEGIYDPDVSYQDGAFSEYTGLQNKTIALDMTVIGATYLDVKEQVQKAATIAHSAKSWTKLYIQRYDRYYTALVEKIQTQKVVGSSMRFLTYGLTFTAKPWLESDTVNVISGTGTVDTGTRSIDNGGWTPATVKISGTDVTVSGYTAAGDFTGFISVSGTVVDMIINSEDYTSTINGVNSENQMYNPDYALFVGPGQTFFEINGATNVEIQYRDRWYL